MTPRSTTAKTRPTKAAASTQSRGRRPGLTSARRKKPAFRFIDLFAGIGGMRLAFESIGGECVFTSELDRFAQVTYSANFPDAEHKIAGDIREVESKSIPDHDVLLAGFPCQPFSLAGVSKKNALGRPHGFECNTSGTLFFEIERILRDRQPRAFLLENVKNLVSHDKGKTWTVIRQTLHDLGYEISERIIDARYWVPQHRERIFIAGFRRKSFSASLLRDFSLKQMPFPDARPTLADILHRPGERIEPLYTDEDGRAAERFNLSPHLWKYLQDYAEKHRVRGNGFGFGLFGPDDVARTLSARYHKDGSEILIKRGSGNPRRLTPRECARLMGFDGNRNGKRFQIPVSDTQAYRQFGNAVVVPVVRSIAEFMAPVFLRGELPENRIIPEKPAQIDLLAAV